MKAQNMMHDREKPLCHQIKRKVTNDMPLCTARSVLYLNTVVSTSTSVSVFAIRER